MRETPKALTTTQHWKLCWGPRLITVPNGNKVRDITMGNPQAYFLSPQRTSSPLDPGTHSLGSKGARAPLMTGYGRVSTTERVSVHNDSLVNLSGLKIQSSPIRKDATS